jgi:hypothetical protein
LENATRVEKGDLVDRHLNNLAAIVGQDNCAGYAGRFGIPSRRAGFTSIHNFRKGTDEYIIPSYPKFIQNPIWDIGTKMVTAQPAPVEYAFRPYPPG